MLNDKCTNETACGFALPPAHCLLFTIYNIPSTTYPFSHRGRESSIPRLSAIVQDRSADRGWPRRSPTPDSPNPNIERPNRPACRRPRSCELAANRSIGRRWASCPWAYPIEHCSTMPGRDNGAANWAPVAEDQTVKEWSDLEKTSTIPEIVVPPTVRKQKPVLAKESQSVVAVDVAS